MGRAGQALQKALKAHNISQNKLAVTMGVERSLVFKWFHEERDPTGETIAHIVQALTQLNPTAARDFVRAYLGDLIDRAHPPEPDHP